MPRGYPDYFGTSVFMKYGGAKRLAGIVTVNAGDTVDIVTLSAKGLLYGGEVFVFNQPDASGDEVRIYVDDSCFFGDTFLNMIIWNTTLKFALPLTLVRYDIVLGDYKVILKDGITFDKNIILQYINNHSNNIGVYYRLYYAEIA